MDTIKLTTFDSPLGTIYAAAVNDGICMVEFSGERAARTTETLKKAWKVSAENGDSLHFDHLKKELAEYFNGERNGFTVPVVLEGTDFQKAVWYTLLKIPYGRTWSYATEAAHMGSPKAVRAVANANGANKISIIIPCHRVIASDGTLAGYGGEVWRKEKLIALEK